MICTCGRDMLPVRLFPGSEALTGYVCAVCGREASDTAYALATAVRGSRRASRPRVARAPGYDDEASAQVAIVKALRGAGYTVLVTSRQRKAARCRCGEWVRAQGGDGCDKGIPDLLVWSAGAGGWRGLEVKSRTGKATAEQAALAEAGMVRIVRTPEEALEAMRARRQE